MGHYAHQRYTKSSSTSFFFFIQFFTTRSLRDLKGDMRTELSLQVQADDEASNFPRQGGAWVTRQALCQGPGLHPLKPGGGARITMGINSCTKAKDPPKLSLRIWGLRNRQPHAGHLKNVGPVHPPQLCSYFLHNPPKTPCIAEPNNPNLR